MNIPYLIKIQRNRWPVLLIDKVINLEPGKSSECLKVFTNNEIYFQGHFKDDPVVPGTILVESMAQSLLVAFQSAEEYSGLIVNAYNYHEVNFKIALKPGDKLINKATIKSIKRGIVRGEVRGYVDEKIACNAIFTIIIPDILENFQRNK